MRPKTFPRQPQETLKTPQDPKTAPRPQFESFLHNFAFRMPFSRFWLNFRIIFGRKLPKDTQKIPNTLHVIIPACLKTSGGGGASPRGRLRLYNLLGGCVLSHRSTQRPHCREGEYSLHRRYCIWWPHLIKIHFGCQRLQTDNYNDLHQCQHVY